jgi:hypothetical protein
MKPLPIHQPKLASVDAQCSQACLPKLKDSNAYKNASLHTTPILTPEDVSLPAQLDNLNSTVVSCALLHALKTQTFMVTLIQDFVKAPAPTINIVIQLTELVLLHARPEDFSCTTLRASSSVHLDFMPMGQEFAFLLVQPTLMEKIRPQNVWLLA